MGYLTVYSKEKQMSRFWYDGQSILQGNKLKVKYIYVDKISEMELKSFHGQIKYTVLINWHLSRIFWITLSSPKLPINNFIRIMHF